MFTDLYSHTIENISKKSTEIFKFDRYKVIKEYFERPVLPPPFIFLSHIFLILKFIFARKPITATKFCCMILSLVKFFLFFKFQ